MRCTCEGFDGSPGIGFVCLFLVSTLLRWTGAQLHTVRTEDDDDVKAPVHREILTGLSL